MPSAPTSRHPGSGLGDLPNQVKGSTQLLGQLFDCLFRSRRSGEEELVVLPAGQGKRIGILIVLLHIFTVLNRKRKLRRSTSRPHVACLEDVPEVGNEPVADIDHGRGQPLPRDLTPLLDPGDRSEVSLDKGNPPASPPFSASSAQAESPSVPVTKISHPAWRRGGKQFLSFTSPIRVMEIIHSFPREVSPPMSETLNWCACSIIPLYRACTDATSVSGGNGQGNQKGRRCTAARRDVAEVDGKGLSAQAIGVRKL